MGSLIGEVSAPKKREYIIIISDTNNRKTGTTIGAPSSNIRLMTRKTGNSTKLKNINFDPRRLRFLRGERKACVSAPRAAGAPPLAIHSANPLIGRPQREQNLISSEICC